MYNIIDLIFNYFGIKLYINRVEFLAHLGWSLFILMCILHIHYIIGIIWFLWVIYDELYNDNHYLAFLGKDPQCTDFLWDLGSKLSAPLIGFIYLISF